MPGALFGRDEGGGRHATEPTIVTGGVVSVLAISVIVGWHARIDWLVQPVAGQAPMQHNAALALALLGLAMLSAARVPRTAGVLGFFAFALGMIALIEYAFATRSGLDELFVDAWETTATAEPGRMAPNTAVGITLLGGAFGTRAVSPRHRQRNIVVMVFALVAGAIALVGGIGYLIGLEAAFGWGDLTAMAPHAALLLIIASAGTAWIARTDPVSDEVAGPTLLPPLVAVGIGALALFLWAALTSLPNRPDDTIPLTVASAAVIVLILLLSVAIALAIRSAQRGHARAQLVRLTLRRYQDELALREQVERELRLRNRDLEIFASAVSHDLRSPLGVISGFAHVLEEDLDDRMTDEEREALDRIVAATKRMYTMIDSLIDYARLGSRAGQAQTTDPNAVLERVLADLELQIDEAGADVEAERLPQVLAHPELLARVFQNLVSNAIKYHDPDRSPEIRIRSRPMEDEMVAIAVEDNGLGIEEAQQEKIFELFERGSATSSGSGIGLALVRRIVQEYGGEAWVDSEPGAGSTFWFTLPAADGQPATDVDEESAAIS